jgi:hypothetical protein
MKTLIFLLLIFCLMCSLVSSAQDSTKRKTPPFTGMKNTAAALVFYDKGTEIGRLTDTNLTGKDSTGTVFIKNVRGWYIADSLRAWPVLTRITELYLNIKR